jgi:hypothetical protein
MKIIREYILGKRRIGWWEVSVARDTLDWRADSLLSLQTLALSLQALDTPQFPTVNISTRCAQILQC